MPAKHSHDVDAAIPMPTFDMEADRAPAFDVGAATTAGKVRKRNEDAYLVQRQSWGRLGQQSEMTLLAVADGMGGHDGGDQAGALTLQALHVSWSAWLGAVLAGREASAQAITDRIGAGLNEASRAVHTSALADSRLKGMGAAAVVAFLWQNQALLGHVGDCRAYHLHGGRVQRLTKDQTLVQKMIDQGTLSPAEALRHPARSELSQAIGLRPEVVPGFTHVPLSRGDWLLLASDGLQAHLTQEELRREVEPQTSASLAVERLLDVVNERGGTDNCTVIAVRVA